MNRTTGQSETVVFSLSGTGSVPVYRQIITQIEHGVLSGRLKAGDRLPTIRALAVELKINPNTIAKAYGELEIRGLLVTRVGSGTFISDEKPDGADEAREAKIREIVGRFLREMEELGVERNAVVNLIGREQCPGGGGGLS
ncbi:MAG: GntR family transcriptional regulator [Spirochaetaceae bacterium]|jgi:GntR family transcriptional regulator|nr:GntR family transcriptional regulator [Spirochaetaceae bacterium]